MESDSSKYWPPLMARDGRNSPYNKQARRIKISIRLPGVTIKAKTECRRTSRVPRSAAVGAQALPPATWSAMTALPSARARLGWDEDDLGGRYNQPTRWAHFTMHILLDVPWQTVTRRRRVPRNRWTRR